MRCSLSAVLVALLLAGCGELPRPFQPGGRDQIDLLERMQDSRGVTVAPVVDAPPLTATALAESMAAAFRKQDIPATARTTLSHGYLLEGEALLENEAAGEADLLIVWRLTDGPEGEVTRTEARHRIPLADWRAGEKPLLDALAAQAAPALAAAIIGEPAAPAAGASRTVSVVVAGAPGDGNEALRRALGTVLRRDGLPPANSPETATVRLVGEVAVTPDTENRDLVRLVWVLRDEQDRELAVMKQQNMVPRDRLSGRWGALAIDIALAMREEIVAAVRRLDGIGGTHLALPPGLR